MCPHESVQSWWVSRHECVHMVGERDVISVCRGWVEGPSLVCVQNGWVGRHEFESTMDERAVMSVFSGWVGEPS